MLVKVSPYDELFCSCSSAVPFSLIVEIPLFPLAYFSTRKTRPARPGRAWCDFVLISFSVEHLGTMVGKLDRLEIVRTRHLFPKELSGTGRLRS